MKRTKITIEAWGDTNFGAVSVLRRLVHVLTDYDTTEASDYDVVNSFGTATAKVEQVEAPDCDGGQ